MIKLCEKNSYKISKISSNVQREINRLKGQVDLFWNNEKKHYEEFGLRDGMKVVEYGSGPGFMSEKLLENYPNMEVTMIEFDSFLAQYSDDYLSERFSGRYNVYVRSVLDSQLQENTYDYAIVRLLIEHLPDPCLAMREVKRVLKTGGKAICVDNDFEMHIMTYPKISELRLFYDVYCKARESEGGNPRIGRELPQILKQSGYTNVDFDIISAHNQIVGDEIFFQSEGISIASKLVKDGLLTSKDLAGISVAWRNVIRNGEHSIVRQLFVAVGEKI